MQHGSGRNPKVKKVLVISYYWPPSGGVSVLRSLKIVKYLRNFGWEPIVYAPKNAHYPYTDTGGFKDIPPGITILKKGIVEPFTAFKWLTGRKSSEPLNSIVQVRSKKQSALDKLGIWIRGNFFIPDARSMWISPSVAYLTKYLKENKVDAIFSDGPPHTNTMIACKLSESTGIPWLADFQDPWTQADYYQLMRIEKWAHRKHSLMEQQVFRIASKLTIASPSWKQDLEKIGAKNAEVIYYGFDEEDFKGLKPNQHPETIDIVHIGLLGIDRHPEQFVQALQKIKSNKKIRIRLAGQVDYEVLEQLRSIEGIEVQDLGTLPRSEALQLAMDAHLLLLPLNKAENAKGRLPAKLYEYLRTGHPILALGPLDSDAARIIHDCKAGICLEYHDQSGMLTFLEQIIAHPESPKTDTSKVMFFSNENQTGKVAEHLNRITKSS